MSCKSAVFCVSAKWPLMIPLIGLVLPEGCTFVLVLCYKSSGLSDPGFCLQLL